MQRPGSSYVSNEQKMTKAQTLKELALPYLKVTCHQTICYLISYQFKYFAIGSRHFLVNTILSSYLSLR